SARSPRPAGWLRPAPGAGGYRPWPASSSPTGARTPAADAAVAPTCVLMAAPPAGAPARSGAGAPAGSVCRRSVARLLAHFEGLDLIAFGDVLVTETDTAFEAVADFGDVVLLPAQRLDGEVVGHHDAVPEQTCLAVAADGARAHDRTGDVAHLGGTEDLADLRRPELDLLVLRLEHALQGTFDVVDRRVDDRVVLDLHALAVGQGGHPFGRADIEADDDGVVHRGQVDVVLRDRTHTAVDDAQLDFLAHVDLEQRVLQCFHGTGDVALDDQVEAFHLALFERLGELLEGDPLAALGQGGGTFGRFAFIGDLPGGAVVRGDQEHVSGPWHRGQPQHLDRASGPGGLHAVAVFVGHGAHASVGRTGHDRIAHVQRPGLDQHGGHGAAPLVQIGLDGHAAGVLVRIRLQFQGRVRGQQHRFEELLDAGALGGGGVH